MERLTYFKDGYWRINFSGVQYQADFVDRLAAYEDIGLCGNCAVLVAVKLLEKVPAADVAEVVHGSGKVRATEEAETTQIIDGCCTACGELMDCCEAADYKFCPYCAKRIV